MLMTIVRGCCSFAPFAVRRRRSRAQIDPRAALVERAAWTALNAGQARAAADGVSRSARRRSEERAAAPRRRHGGGARAARRRRARRVRARARARSEADAGARAARADPVPHGRSRLRAMRTYETLVAMAPDDRDARATLERWRREADLHDRMQQAVGSHFTVSFEGPAEADARRRSARGARPRLLAHRPAARHLSDRADRRSCSTPASSSATSRGRRRGRPARTTASSACRCAARSTSARSSIACSRTSSRTR